MKKTLLAAATLSLLLVLAVVSEARNMTLELKAVDGSSASGMAMIEEKTSRFGQDMVKINIKAENVQTKPGTLLEGWLIDMDSGYKLSIGAFSIKKNGKGELQFEQHMVNFGVYDKLVITREKIDDTNPNPDVAVLEGDLKSAVSTERIVKMKANLMGSNQVPPVSTNAKGEGEFTVDTKMNKVTFKIKFEDLSSAETGAHIHGFAAPGSNAGILFALPMGSPKTGTWNYNENQEAGILAGKTYVNMHSVNFPAGEIRGQIVPK